MRIKTTFFLILYYGFARHLPVSHTLLGKIMCARAIRYYCCKHIFKYTGQNVNVEHGAWFGNGAGIEIGDNSGIGVNAHIYHDTVIGKNVMMGPNCYMLENTHQFSSTDIPMIEQGFKGQRDHVIIGDDIWIGKDVLIIGTKEIKSGTIIGARCVLTKSFPEYSIVGGNPSVLIRNRKDK